MENGPVEIVDFPIGDFPIGKMLVRSPEGNHRIIYDHIGSIGNPENGGVWK